MRTTRERADAFVMALEEAVGAGGLSVERGDGCYYVSADIDPPDVNRAQSVAAGYDFQLVGGGGSGRYRFRTWDDSGLGLPGGVR